MRIGVPKETAAGEHRVALVPEVVGKLQAKGLEVLVQTGAGEGALLADDTYTAAGANIALDAAPAWRCSAVLTIATPDAATPPNHAHRPQQYCSLAPAPGPEPGTTSS